jgi:multicomponent K+:H+ antiporter subunit E
MTRFLPFPRMSFCLLALWLLLNQAVTVGHVLLGCVIALVGGRFLTVLELPSTRVRRPGVLLRLLGLVAIDIIRSNFAVGRIILGFGRRQRKSGFVNIPLDMRNPYGLALLACIITSSPGTLWVNYDEATLRTPSAGDIRMSQLLLIYALVAAQVLLVLAIGCGAVRIFRGPRAQDRVLGFDTLSVNAMLLLLTFGIRSGETLYFEAALAMALFGFVGTVALAKFLLRGEVIE